MLWIYILDQDQIFLIHLLKKQEFFLFFNIGNKNLSTAFTVDSKMALSWPIFKSGNMFGLQQKFYHPKIFSSSLCGYFSLDGRCQRDMLGFQVEKNSIREFNIISVGT